jgi:hypothetical protein
MRNLIVDITLAFWISVLLPKNNTLFPKNCRHELAGDNILETEGVSLMRRWKL